MQAVTLKGWTLGSERALDRAERIRVAAFEAQAVRALLLDGGIRDAFSALALHHHFAGARARGGARAAR